MRMLLSANPIAPDSGGADVGGTQDGASPFGPLHEVALPDGTVAAAHLLEFDSPEGAMMFVAQAGDAGVQVLAAMQVRQSGPPVYLSPGTVEIDPTRIFEPPLVGPGPTIIFITPMRPGPPMQSPPGTPPFIGPPTFPNPFGPPTRPYQPPPSQPPGPGVGQPATPLGPAPVDPNGGMKPPGSSGNPPSGPTGPVNPAPSGPAPGTPSQPPVITVPNPTYPHPGWTPNAPPGHGGVWTPGPCNTWVEIYIY